MSKYSYLITPEQLAKTFTSNTMYDMEGYMAIWESKESVLQKLLPEPLKVDGNTVSVYVANCLAPTLMPWYRETSLTIKCKYGDREGYWIQSLLLNGPGTEMGTYLGREGLNMPKKMCEKFEITRVGSTGKAVVGRNGTDLITITADINGKYNDPRAEKEYAKYVVGQKAPYNSFFYNYDKGVFDGKPGFRNGRFTELAIDLDIKRWDPATVDIQLGETPDDPWAELEVVKVLGGAYCRYDLYMTGRTFLSQEEDASANVLKVIKHRFDSCTYCDYSQVL